MRRVAENGLGIRESDLMLCKVPVGFFGIPDNIHRRRNVHFNPR